VRIRSSPRSNSYETVAAFRARDLRTHLHDLDVAVAQWRPAADPRAGSPRGRKEWQIFGRIAASARRPLKEVTKAALLRDAQTR